ncbi:MAG: phosphomannose isomerase type II C-terminal cupin domain [bacterium]|nr:phosphomannose isomerase type II C-terminal cupin domain [bacterium]
MDTKILPSYYIEKRPWGSFEQFILNEKATVKILELLPDREFSLQKHSNRDEFWRVLDGAGIVTLDNERNPAKKGDEFYAPRGMAHRAKASEEGMRILEISMGTFDEHDETRLEDDFGRR